MKDCTLFEEEKNEQNYPPKTKKLFISSLPLVQKALQNKNIRKKITRKDSLFRSKRNIILKKKYQTDIKDYENPGYKIKKNIGKNNNITFESESSSSNLIPRNLMRFSSYKNTIIIDSNGNNNLNDEQRNLISNYLYKNKKIKIKINPNKPKNICSRNTKKSKTTNDQNIFEIKNKTNRNKKLLHLPKKSKTLCSEQNQKLLESVKDNIDEKIKNILYKNLIQTKNQSMIFADVDISNEIKENNDYGSFLESSIEDDEFSKGLIENLKLL